MRDDWKSGSLSDLVEEVISEPVANPSQHELLTVRLHAKGVVKTGKRPNTTANGRKHYIRKPGEILVGRQNYHHRCAGIVLPEFNGCVTSNAVSAFIPVTGVEPDFALIIMQSQTTAEAADSLMPGTGQREISVKNILKIPVLVPPLAEQQRIVDLIGSLDEAIEAADDLHSHLVSTQFKTLFDTYLRKASEITTVAALASFMIGGAWGDPEGMSETTVNALGPSAFANDATEVVDSLGTARSLSSSKANKRYLQPGDIIIERSGGSPTQPVGRVVRAVTPAASTVPSDFMRLVRVDPSLASRDYVFWALWMRYRNGDTIPFQKNTTNIRNLNITDYLASDFRLMKSADDQNAFVVLAESFSDASSEANAHSTSLRRLRTNLLTALLSGAHEIPESYDVLLPEVA